MRTAIAWRRRCRRARSISQDPTETRPWSPTIIPLRDLGRDGRDGRGGGGRRPGRPGQPAAHARRYRSKFIAGLRHEHQQSCNVTGAGLVDADAAVGLAESLTFALNASQSQVLGTHLNDAFIAGPGTFTINGEGGHDTIAFQGNRAAYAIAANSDGSVTTTDPVVSRDGVDTILNVQYLRFADQRTFVETPDNADIARLYNAALGRLPDIQGLNGWEDIYAANVSAAVKAQGPYVALAETPGGYAGALSIAAGFTTWSSSSRNTARSRTALS